MTEKRKDDLVSGRLGQINAAGGLSEPPGSPESTYGRVRLGLMGVEAAPMTAQDIFEADEPLDDPSFQLQTDPQASQSDSECDDPPDDDPPNDVDEEQIQPPVPGLLGRIVAYLRYGRRLYVAGGVAGVLLAGLIGWTLSNPDSPTVPASAHARSSLLPPIEPQAPALSAEPKQPEVVVRTAWGTVPKAPATEPAAPAAVDRILIEPEPVVIVPDEPAGPVPAPQKPGSPKAAPAPDPSPAVACDPVKTYRDPPTGLKLLGVVQTPNGRLASVNGRMLAVGEVIDGAKVVEITDFAVEMELKGEYFQLGMLAGF